ncbi:MAG TPA: nucleotide exchange factor GrpE [Clostridiaceae bacterium]|nr:nucleotide exchange factor GrpE [Clostridiaceae bacterium]
MDNNNEKKEKKEAVEENLNEKTTFEENKVEDSQSSEKSSAPSNEEFEKLMAQLEEKSKAADEYFSRLQRTAAEFDNYRKRTAREKEAIYTEAVCDVVSAFLPIIDDIDRALQVCEKEAENSPIKEGVELIKRKANEVLKNLGVEEIDCKGKEFDPSLHEAVMHVEDEEYGQNIIVEEFRKGYKTKDKVIRHSVVKVAN